MPDVHPAITSDEIARLSAERDTERARVATLQAEIAKQAAALLSLAAERDHLAVELAGTKAEAGQQAAALDRVRAALDGTDAPAAQGG